MTGSLIFQQFYYHYYNTSITIYLITVSHGTSAALLLWLSILFFSWYRSSNNKLVFLYFLSILIISSNLILTPSQSIRNGRTVLTDDELADFMNTVKDCTGAYFKVQDIEMHKNSGKVFYMCVVSAHRQWVESTVMFKYHKDKMPSPGALDADTLIPDRNRQLQKSWSG